MSHQNISLIGYRGTGKSQVGLLLAARVGRRCVDTDFEIERQAGCSIREIFAKSGEPAFRELESEVIREFTSLSDLVLSLGGGAILRAENCRLIQASGPVIWLRASVATIAQRIGLDPSSGSRRPDLTQAGGVVEIETLLAKREPLYEACASIAIDTDNRIPEDLATEIISRCGLVETSE